MLRTKWLTAGLVAVIVTAAAALGGKCPADPGQPAPVAQKPRAESPPANLPSDFKRLEEMLQKDPMITGKRKEIEALKQRIEKIQNTALPKVVEKLSQSHQKWIAVLQKEIDDYVRSVYETSKQPEGPPDKVDSSRLLTPERFEDLDKLIRPSAGESRWEEIPWLLSVYDARKKAAEEGKPIIIWWAAGSSPLGGC